MLSISKILPAGLAAVLLAGCGASAPVDRVAGPAGSSSPSPAPSASPGSSAPVDGPRYGGDSPPSDAPTTIPVTSAAPVASACGLIRPDDIVTVVGDTVKLDFPTAPTEKTRVDFLVGTASICHTTLTSQFNSGGGTSKSGGFVTVQVQTAGASDYFPVHGDDTRVTGIGDDAMVRHYVLYVRLGTGMLVLTVAISTADYSPDHNVEWAKRLAAIAIRRL